MTTNRSRMDVFFFGLQLCVIAFSIAHCNARRSTHLLRGQSTKKIVVTKNLDIYSAQLDDVPTNTVPNSVGSPFTIPPYDSLPPIAWPEQNTPSFCIDSPIMPLPPPTDSDGSGSGNTLPPPSSSSNPTPTTPSPTTPTGPGGPEDGPSGPDTEPSPTNPGTSPNPSNPGTSPNPSNPGTSPNPSNPGTSPNPSNPGTSPNLPNPGTSPNPPNPGTSPNPSNPGSGSSVPVPNPSPDVNPPIIFPSPPSLNPSPPEPELSPPYYEPSPPTIVLPSPPSTDQPPSIFIPSPPVFQPPVVYPPPAVPPPPRTAHSGALWCVAKPTVPDPIIQEAMDYACGSGGDCGSIQPDGLCFHPDTLYAHSSYAFNSYWQRTKVAGGRCDFGGTAMLVTVDPSYDGCHFVLF